MQQQLNHAISQNCRFGQSKHADKSNPQIQTKDYIYSIKSAESHRDTVSNFCTWLKDKQAHGEHTDIKFAKDITPDIIKEWVTDRSDRWSDKTLESHLSRWNKIETMINNTYHTDLRGLTDFQLPTRENRENMRAVKMERDDLDKLVDDLSSSDRRINALRAVEISSRVGLRIEEIACLRYNRINLDKGVIEVREGAKNGRSRDVPIRQQDKPYFKDLKAQKDHEYVCHGVQSKALNKTIRESMKRCEIDDKYKLTTNHSIRKLYATERYLDELKKCGDSRQAWEKVQGELGHGTRFRSELFRAYIKI